MKPIQRATALACALAVVACDSPDYRPLQIGDALPSYSARSLEGGESTLPGGRGPLLINVWATWCVPCRTEMPALQKLHDEYASQRLEVIGISIDTGGDEGVRGFLADVGATFPVLRDPDDRVTRTFRLVGVPETLLIDAHGVIAHRWIGAFDPLSQDARDRIEKVLTPED